jgi:hypothetical protein
MCAHFLEDHLVHEMCETDLKDIMGMLIDSKVVHWDAVDVKTVVPHLTNNILSGAINLQCLAARVANN